MTRSIFLALFVWLGGLVAIARAEAPDRITSIEVEGTMFRVRLSGGKVLSGPDLVGATLSVSGTANAAPLRVFIESVMIDPTDRDHETVLYHFLAVDPATQQKVELCGPNAQGERWGFPLRGQWDAEGGHQSDAGYTLTCSDGAQGKCVRWGYKPWKTLTDGTRLDAYHQACIRLVRADYCGGHGTTRDGMLIDIYDNIGVNEPDPKAAEAGLRLEAAWSPAGAVCVAHTRVPEKITLEQLNTQCSRLAGRLGEDVCTEKSVAHLPGGPVLLYNRSR
jgi:ADYC domain